MPVPTGFVAAGTARTPPDPAPQDKQQSEPRHAPGDARFEQGTANPQNGPAHAAANCHNGPDQAGQSAFLPFQACRHGG